MVLSYLHDLSGPHSAHQVGSACRTWLTGREHTGTHTHTQDMGHALCSPHCLLTECVSCVSVCVCLTQVIIAESYGGSDESADILANEISNSGAEMVVDPLKIKDLPNQALYQQFEEAGEYRHSV